MLATLIQTVGTIMVELLTLLTQSLLCVILIILLLMLGAILVGIVKGFYKSVKSWFKNKGE